MYCPVCGRLCTNDEPVDESDGYITISAWCEYCFKFVTRKEVQA